MPTTGVQDPMGQGLRSGWLNFDAITDNIAIDIPHRL
jgi:hypothetical protein